jgi:ribosomal protein S6--L-glutamate ligase
MTEKKKTIGILSMKSEDKLEHEIYSRFPEEIKKRGYEAEILYFDKFFIYFNDKIEVYYDQKKMNPEKYRFMIFVMDGKEENSFIAETLQGLGVKIINSVTSTRLAKNKIRTKFALSQAGIPIIPTAINFSQYRLQPIFDHLGEELIYKLNRGALGKGVACLDSKISTISTFELLAAAGVPPSNIIFEKFVKESAGQDIRIIVAGGKVVAAMKRMAGGIDFRGNLSGIGRGERIDISETMAGIAIKSAETLGLSYAGVDILISNDGPQVIEVNPNPGLKIEQVLDKNVVGEALEEMLKI